VQAVTVPAGTVIENDVAVVTVIVGILNMVTGCGIMQSPTVVRGGLARSDALRVRNAIIEVEVIALRLGKLDAVRPNSNGTCRDIVRKRLARTVRRPSRKPSVTPAPVAVGVKQTRTPISLTSQGRKPGSWCSGCNSSFR